MDSRPLPQGETPARSPASLVLSCEHATCRVPDRYAHCFVGREDRLAGHHGWDPGALPLARELARALEAPLVAAPVSRLLVETNRSEHHPRLFSDATRDLPAPDRRRLVERYWRPHRERVLGAVRDAASRGSPVLHVGVHSFTPVLDGRTRAFDCALLYDPARPAERDLAARWIALLRERLPGLRVRRNAPYRGADDGLTTSLRGMLPPEDYLGFELELNQALPLAGGAPWRAIRRAVVQSLAALMAGPD